MSDLHSRTMSGFELYLRTGLRFEEPGRPAFKYNPWHDPDDGRFTFRNQGVNYGGGGRGGGDAYGDRPRRKRSGEHYEGYGGGGAGVNGGGASGSWPAPEPSPSADERSSSRLTPKPTRNKLSKQPIRPKIDRVPEPRGETNAIRHVVEKNGYRFGLDEQLRTVVVTGQLSVPQAVLRSRAEQRRAGGSQRRSHDDGGHFIAARFGGPQDAYNHFAQNASFNRGGYRVIEDGWAKDLRAGRRIAVNVSAIYPTHSKRPSGLVVRWKVNGASNLRVFSNDKDHGK